MSIHLTDRQIEILSFLRDQSTEEVNKLLRFAIEGTLHKRDIETVCQQINNEYLLKGIKEDYNPNEYGKELEDLLNIINKSRFET